MKKLSAVILLASPGIAYADVVPLPPMVADDLWFGLPLGPIVGLVLLAAAVLLYLRVRKAGKGRGRAAAFAILLFVAGNLLCYVLAAGQRRPRDYPLPPPNLGRIDGASENPRQRVR